MSLTLLNHQVFTPKSLPCFDIIVNDVVTFHSLQKCPLKKVVITETSRELNLTLKAPVTTAADDSCFFLIFFILQRKQILTFHVNCLPSR